MLLFMKYGFFASHPWLYQPTFCCIQEDSLVKKVVILRARLNYIVNCVISELLNAHMITPLRFQEIELVEHYLFAGFAIYRIFPLFSY